MRGLWIAAGVVGLAGTVSADTVNLRYMGAGAGRTVRVTLGTQTWDVFAGRLMHQTSGGTGTMAGLPSSIATFSADILQGRAVAAPGAYATSAIALLSGNAGSQNLGYGKQQAIYDVFAAAQGRQYTLGQDYATGFQVALWEIIYDFNPTQVGNNLNASAGRFHATMPGQGSMTAAITAVVQSLLGAVGTRAGRGGLVGLRSGGYQDQFYMGELVVPLPTGVWMGLAGLGVAAAVRRRRMGRSAAQ